MMSRYSNDELMTRLKVFIGACLAMTLVGIVFVVLYSIIFVPQPLNAMSPVDAKFFELIIPIATFLTGTLSGIMLGSTKMNTDSQYEDTPPAPVSRSDAPDCESESCPKQS
jgi:hypothetical protein